MSFSQEYAEKLRAEFEQEKKRAVNVATRSLERDLERLKADHGTEVGNFPLISITFPIISIIFPFVIIIFAVISISFPIIVIIFAVIRIIFPLKEAIL